MASVNLGRNQTGNGSFTKHIQKKRGRCLKTEVATRKGYVKKSPARGKKTQGRARISKIMSREQ